MKPHPQPTIDARITFRRATLADKPGLFAFIRRAWPDHWQYRIPDRWRWLYETNPFVEQGVLPVWIAVNEVGQIVAQTNAMIEPIRIGGRDRLIGWGCSAYTAPEHRRQGIGTALEKLNAESHDVSGRLGMPDQMRRNMSKLGAVPIDGVGQYVCDIRFDRHSANDAIARRLAASGSDRKHRISKILRQTAIDRVFAGALNQRAASRLAAVPPYRDQGLTLREVDRFGAETDALWQRLGPRYDAIVCRDAKFCNWKYVEQPHMHYRRWIAWSGDEPRGYVVLRQAAFQTRRIGIVADLFAAPDDEPTIRTLLAFATDHLRREGMHKLRAATTIAEIGQCLELAGFRKSGEVSPMLHQGVGGEVGTTAGRWFLGKSDCDWDQFPLCERAEAQRMQGSGRARGHR